MDMEAIAAETVIPHRPPMRLIDTLETWSEAGAQASVVFDATHLAVDSGRVTEAALVECLAQTVAAMEGARAAAAGTGGQLGMLCGVADFTVLRRPCAGERLEVRVRAEKRLGSMLLAAGEVWCNGSLAASGALKLSV